MGWIEGILGVAGSGLAIWLWWLNNRAATKEEVKELIQELRDEMPAIHKKFHDEMSIIEQEKRKKSYEKYLKENK